MATFYLLPPRAMVEQRWQSIWQAILPGARLRAAEGWADLLAESLGEPDGYLVFRDELPVGEDPLAALRDGYGAEPGDRVVEVRWASPADPPRVCVRGVAAPPCSDPSPSGYNSPS